MLAKVARSVISWGILALVLPLSAVALTVVAPQVRLESPAARDQDDMCIWLHPLQRALSVVVTSDRTAERLFVYDLEGRLLQNLQVPGMPGNVDVRYDFPLGDARIDIVAYNDRTNGQLGIFRLDRRIRHLSRIDDGGILIGASYGCCLYRSPVDGAYYAFVTTEAGGVRQFRLQASGERVSGSLVREWALGSKTEGCVADDETGFVYVAQETVGIWKTDAEPEAPTTPTLVAAVGDESGLRADVEGLALYYGSEGSGYLIASSKGTDDFRVWDRRPPHAFLTSFSVSGVGGTDGIDVTNVALGPHFPGGMFAVHNGNPSPRPVELCSWEDMGLTVDVESWDPRAATPLFEYRSAPVETGYRDHSWGDELLVSPTAEKPESKLWWNDGSWWGVLWDPTTACYRICRYDRSTPSWVLAGPPVDDRPYAISDVLWDGSRLYVASHVRSTWNEPGRLYRYRFDSGERRYHLDAGFPVNVNDDRTEALTIAKDGTGKLWATWERRESIWVNRTLGDDLTWGEPFALPVAGADVSADDISAIVAFDGRIGIAWSNQTDDKTRFAVHRDGAPDDEWEGPEEPLAGTGARSDDHLNLKTFEGSVYLAAKTTAPGPGQALVYLARRDPAGTWTQSFVGSNDERHTRAIVLIDEDHRMAHVFAMTPKGSPGDAIRRKSADLDDLVFETGVGVPFIVSSADSFVNNPSSTRQNVNRETGLLVIASDAGSHHYLHNFMSLDDVLRVDDVRVSHLDEASRHLYSSEVVVRDGFGRAVEGATVTGRWDRPEPTTATAGTDANGVARFTLRTQEPEFVTFCVAGVRYGDYAFDPDASSEMCEMAPGGSPGSGPVAYLRPAYPNPFQVDTTIRVSLAQRERVRLTVYNAAGQRVRTLVNRVLPDGEHEIRWDGRDADGKSAAAGVYWYRLETEGLTRTRKMSLLR